MTSSLSKIAPSATATTGFANVISGARAGPTSSSSLKKTTNASPVHTSASTITATTDLEVG